MLNRNELMLIITFTSIENVYRTIKKSIFVYFIKNIATIIYY